MGRRGGGKVITLSLTNITVERAWYFNLAIVREIQKIFKDLKTARVGTTVVDESARKMLLNKRRNFQTLRGKRRNIEY